MTTDTRCCGTGTCLINTEGLCWCGQRWNGDQMCGPGSEPNQPPALIDQGQTAAEVAANQTTNTITSPG